ALRVEVLAQPVKVYNFQVADLHTYYAAPEADKPFVWVHNANYGNSWNAYQKQTAGVFGSRADAAAAYKLGKIKLKGRSTGQAHNVLQKNGFVLKNPGNPKNSRYELPGTNAQVQIHKYGGNTWTPHKSANNAHAHKSIGRHLKHGSIELDDMGMPTSPFSDAAHIGLKNPGDFPAIAGRPNGS